jgi:hypothetical protein
MIPKQHTRPRFIEVAEFGDGGYAPTDRDREQCYHHGECSCISSGEGSVCGGFNGTIDMEGLVWVMCTNPKRRKKT